ncbi:MAG: GIY-YIG nuclease family protein [Candidatus Thorarchaeota archaeon]|jgi:sugar fermentation stimulation protein A
MKGVYALVIAIPADIDVQIGALGTQRFEVGEWIYVGSAFGNGSTSLEHRVRRHFSREKKLHWHIDLLMEVTGPPTHVIWSKAEKKRECEIANKLKQHEEFMDGPKGFGSSDCTAKCGTHLFKHNGRNACKTIQNLFAEISLEPQSLDDLS